MSAQPSTQKFLPCTPIKDFLITGGLFILATLCSFLLYFLAPDSSANIALLYILALVLTAYFTSSYLPGIIASVGGVICINFLFTYPYFQLNFSLTGYPVTFLVMLAISLLTSTATSHMKQQAIILSERKKLLIEAEKEKIRANLLRAVSHDLRTPLTSIIGASNSYLENSSHLSVEEQRELISHISEDANWLLNMVENLLSITRINDHSATVTKSLEPVEEVLSEAVFRFKKRNPDAQILVSIPDEFFMIPMDAILIEQVIINMLENAYMHAQSKKPIECYIKADDKNITFYVKDYGIGIPQDRLTTIFDGTPYQASSSDVKKGMGIGLSICKTIILAHGGTIHAENHENGAVFYFLLPREEYHFET